MTRRLRSRAWLLSLALNGVLAAVILSGATPGTEVARLEQRLAVLETVIRSGQDGSSQVRAPFQVLDGSGKVLLNVAERGGTGAVNISRASAGGGTLLSLYTAAGKEAVSVGTSPEGHGRVFTRDSDGKLAATLSEVGMNVHNSEGEIVAGVTRGGGVGRIGIWRNDRWVTELTSDQAGNGRLKTYSAAGKLRAVAYGESGLGVFDDQEKSVVSLINRGGRGVVGVSGTISDKLFAELTVDSSGGGVLHMKAPDGKIALGLYGTTRTFGIANSSGQTVADITVSQAGNGLFQVWGAGGRLPYALLGKSVEGTGGIMQLSNGTAITTSLTVSGGRNGFWQLNDAAGDPMVEAGVTQEKRGLVRAGPLVKCVPAKSVMGFTRVPDCIHGRTEQ